MKFQTYNEEYIGLGSIREQSLFVSVINTNEHYAGYALIQSGRQTIKTKHKCHITVLYESLCGFDERQYPVCCFMVSFVSHSVCPLTKKQVN